MTKSDLKKSNAPITEKPYRTLITPGNTRMNNLYEESLEFHKRSPKGKIGMYLLKPLTNQSDLARAYTPGVAEPCLKIYNNPDDVFEYTSKSNLVAVITNGTAVLGLGNIGPAASKPVMEGKAALFKRFADIDAVDIEVDTEDADKFIQSIRYLGESWGGINLEDIKAPECFIIERELKKHMNIPVFHDDQHGTAIITGAGILNAVSITNRSLDKIKIIVNGAGAAAIACSDLLLILGAKRSNITMCDTKGVIYKGRTEGMNEWKEAYASDTEKRTLEEAITDADVFIGLSSKGALTQDMVKKMAPSPIIFAMANPEPEITPNEVRQVRQDAIIATGRSDYNNQVNNVLGFPYIFRGALDVQATTINDEMKIAAAYAIAKLAKENITEEVELASGRKCVYGPEYIIPISFDSRLIQEVSAAVAEAAIKSGVARKTITDFTLYKRQLAARLNPTAILTNQFFEYSINHPKRMIFVEGEEEQMLKAAVQWYNHGCGKAILIGYEDSIRDGLAKLGIYELPENDGITINNATINPDTSKYIDLLYKKLQRHGYVYRDCVRLIKRDRNIFAASILNAGLAEGMVTGLTRSYLNNIEDVSKVITPSKNKVLFTMSILMKRDQMIFIADTAINENPTPEQLVKIAIEVAKEVRIMGHEPRVAFMSFMNFGNTNSNVHKAISLLNDMNVDFEYDGEMCANIALNMDLLKMYQFCKLSGPANILIMPDLNSASIASKLLQEFGKAVMIGPILCGMKESVQIVNMGSNSVDVFNAAMLAANKTRYECS